METTFRRKLWFLSIVLLVFSILATIGYGYYKHQSKLASDPVLLNKLIQGKVGKPGANSASGRGDGMRPLDDAAILFTVEEPSDNGNGGAGGGGRSGRN